MKKNEKNKKNEMAETNQIKSLYYKIVLNQNPKSCIKE